MVGRRPDEKHRVASQLELLFDLCFVVAIAQAGLALESRLHDGQVGSGVLGYLMVFFAIWWAWMNFSWFASAYDTDDVPYRLLVLVQIVGSLVLAAGVDQALVEQDFVVITWGYVVMRLAAVVNWLRAAHGDPAHRPAALMYAGGIVVIQICWLLRLLLPSTASFIAFFVLAAAELAVPLVAERLSPTAYHPRHIAERYGLFTVIVLGEAVTAAALAFKAGVAASDHPTPLIVLAAMGTVILFSLWWLYFDQESHGRGLDRISRALRWGYGHLLVFASAAAVGVGITTAVAYDLQHAAGAGTGDGAHLSSMVAAGAVTVPIAVFLASAAVLGVGSLAHPPVRRLIPVSIVLVVACTFTAAPVHLCAAVLALTVLAEIVLTRSRAVPVRAAG